MKATQAVVILVALGAVGAAPARAQGKPPAPMPVTAAMPVASGQWVAAQGGAIPAGARPVGYEPGGYLYACRAQLEGGTQPGKVRPGFDGCFVPLNGRENSVRAYEVLVGNSDWEIARDGDVPQGAVEAGRTRTGQPLYACRSAGSAGQLQPGRAGAGLRGCSIGVGGLEVTQATYEVLIQR